MKRNFKLIVAYDGTRYFGWEHQPNTDLTIQGKLETVLARMMETAGGAPGDSPGGSAADGFTREDTGHAAASANTGIKSAAPKAAARGGTGHAAASADAGIKSADPKGTVPEVIGAGRTDAGVHALGMTANVWLDTALSADAVRDYLNRYLPEDICVKDVREAGERFHARYRAQGKTYRYTCYVGDRKPLFDRKYVWHLDGVPDLEKMRRAAAHLTGTHDYASFCGNPRMKKSTVRTVDRIEIVRKGSYLTFTYHGTGFLQYMVRILTGTLLETGFGKRDPDSIPALIEARNRAEAGPTVPAKGLCLLQVDYQ